MNQSPPVTADATAPQPAGARSTKGATEQSAPVKSDLAVIPLTDVLHLLHSTDNGLSASDAAAILKTVGPNQTESAKPKSLLTAFLEKFRNPLVLILLFAAAVSAFTGDIPSFSIIASIVLMSVILDVTQEHQAQNAAESLRKQVALSAKALRDRKPVDIPAADIVPGDVVLLAAGDLVPADSRLIEARDLFVDEALLTGEAYPAEKDATLAAGAAALETAFPPNLVFMGSSVVSGTAKALVLATGSKAQLGSIAGALQKPPPPTAFEVGIQNFGMMIVKATIFLVLFVVLVNILFHRPLLESFQFALALAVGLTPELLPMIVSVTLAHGAMRLSRRQVIVKRQSAIDDLGSMDVFCSDKTGTLTEAHIKLVREVDIGGQDSDAVMQMAQLNAAFETGLKSPLDEAILAAGKIDLAAWRKIDEVPFDFERRRVSILAEGGGRRLLIVKGAPEDILAHATSYEQGGTPPRLFDAASRKTAEMTFNGLGAEGYRVLGVAWREVEANREKANIADEAELTFAGFMAFRDPPKAGAREALTALANLGIALKVVTGDNEQVTRHVCGELGLKVTGTLTGPEVSGLTDEALSARIDDTTLFCRVTPPQKSRIVTALQRKGHVVGYLGDGINDAPSLHAADVGFSVDTAVDVAKEAAAIILLRKDLGVLVDGVREGRKTFVNIFKYMMMGTSSNFGNMFSMAGGVLFLPFLPMLPTQILLNNLLYDLSETTIPLDEVSDEMVAKPRRWDIDIVRKFMFVFGPLSSIFDFITFGLLLWVFHADEKLFHTGWFVESLSTQVLVIFIIRTAHPFKDRPHPALVASTLLAFTLAVALPYSPLAQWLGFVPVPAALMGALALVTMVYLIAVYGVRLWFFDHYRVLNTSKPITIASPGTGVTGTNPSQANTETRRNMMSSLDSSPADMQRAVKDALGANWRLFLFQGAVLIILGVLAIGVLAVVAPSLATRAVDIYIGWLFLISGTVGLVATVSADDIPAFLWSLITAALSVAVGILFGVFLLIWKPVEDALSMTIMLPAFFIAEGAFQIAASLAYRNVLAGGWMLASSIVSLGLAAVIISIAGWPTTAIAGWALGLIVGVNLITSGWAILMMGFAGRDAAGCGAAPPTQARQ